MLLKLSLVYYYKLCCIKNTAAFYCCKDLQGYLMLSMKHLCCIMFCNYFYIFQSCVNAAL